MKTRKEEIYNYETDELQEGMTAYFKTAEEFVNFMENSVSDANKYSYFAGPRLIRYSKQWVLDRAERYEAWFLNGIDKEFGEAQCAWEEI